MDEFLYTLAERKYRMWHELYKFKSVASRKQECIDRILYLERYETHLEIIDLLPIEQKRQLGLIEQEVFSDAPYVFNNK